jgi:hypothetical protein
MQCVLEKYSTYVCAQVPPEPVAEERREESELLICVASLCSALTSVCASWQALAG